MLFRPEIKESLTLKFAESAAERSKKGLPIISLGLGEPEFKTPVEIIEATIEVLKKKNSGYSSPLGLQSLREKLAQKMKVENGIPAQADNIIVTAGAKQAFQLMTMTLLQPEDEVIVLNPSFVSFIPQILISEPNCKIIKIDVSKSDFSLPIAEITQVITDKTKLLILNTPNNPAGYMLKKDELEELFALAKNHNFFILSDEIYEKLAFDDEPHFSIGSLEEKVEKVITINGFSKSHAMTGWRLGYACFPSSMKGNLLKIQQHTNTNTTTFIQEAVSMAFELNTQYLTEYNEKLRNRIDRYMQMVNRLEKVTSVRPTGGFFAFMNISNLGIDSNTFCSRLIEETGVATTPGIAFGDNWDDHVRISFAIEDEKLDEGLRLMEEFITNINS